MAASAEQIKEQAQAIANQAQAIADGKIPEGQLFAQAALIQGNAKILAAWVPEASRV